MQLQAPEKYTWNRKNWQDAREVQTPTELSGIFISIDLKISGIISVEFSFKDGDGGFYYPQPVKLCPGMLNCYCILSISRLHTRNLNPLNSYNLLSSCHFISCSDVESNRTFRVDCMRGWITMLKSPSGYKTYVAEQMDKKSHDVQKKEMVPVKEKEKEDHYSIHFTSSKSRRTCTNELRNMS